MGGTAYPSQQPCFLVTRGAHVHQGRAGEFDGQLSAGPEETPMDRDHTGYGSILPPSFGPVNLFISGIDRAHRDSETAGLAPEQPKRRPGFPLSPLGKRIGHCEKRQ
jgi:hypothetical protein